MPHRGRDRAEYDRELAYEASIAGADLVVLAGWNRLLTDDFLAHHRVINLHPAKPGAFPGLGAIEAAFAAWERGEIKSGGVMVHYVPDEGVDDGPVIAWEEIRFSTGETLAKYEARVHQVEHRLLVESIGKVLAEQRTVF
jgi:folate-dependent phosphoribosylglycinamide formyltransferase PurN